MLVSDLIQRTRQDLYGSFRGQYNKTATLCNTTDTSLTLTYPLKGLTPGTFVAIDDEIIYVWSAPASGVVADAVERAQMGTTATSHASGSFVEVSPRFPKVTIRNALVDEINSWPYSLYGVGSLELSVSAWQRGLDLAGIPSNVLRLLDIRRSPLPGNDTWPQLSGRLERNADATSFPSGNALFLNRQRWNALTWPNYSDAYTLRITYAIPFTTTTFTDATDLSTIGITQDMWDIPRLGACARLLAVREVDRSNVQAQGEARDAREVPIGSILRDAVGLKALRDERIRQEVERLINSYGWRRAQL